jgi:hypothetical protein
MRSVRDGNGPTVSDGVTAQAAALPPPVVVVVVADGLVGLLPHPTAIAAPAAPIIVIASRRLTVRLLRLSTASSLGSPCLPLGLQLGRRCLLFGRQDREEISPQPLLRLLDEQANLLLLALGEIERRERQSGRAAAESAGSTGTASPSWLGRLRVCPRPEKRHGQSRCHCHDSKSTHGFLPENQRV